MFNLKKEFKRGEYYQTYEMMLVLNLDAVNNKWVYNTFYRKDSREPWVQTNCDEDKVLPIINDMINEELKFIKDKKNYLTFINFHLLQDTNNVFAM